MKRENWGDGTPMIKAYYVNGIGSDDSNKFEAEWAYSLYDAYTHNQMTVDEIIKELGSEIIGAAPEVETVGRGCKILGYSDDLSYFLTYDQYTGALDVWEISEEDYAWLSEEDAFGKIGAYGAVRSYDVGYMTLDNCEMDAKECGYDSVEDYLRSWASEASLAECTFQWQWLGSGYGFHGTTLFEADDIVHGHLVCKEIYGQIMFDAYPPNND